MRHAQQNGSARPPAALPGDTRRVALLLPTDMEYGRAILRGIKSYARPDMPWRFLVAMPDLAGMQVIRSWKPTGVIAQVSRAELIAPLRRLRKPVVNVSNTLARAPTPRVGMDNVALGQVAAEYFVERGLGHFGFVGHVRHAFAREREEGFRAWLTRAGHASVHSFHSPAVPWGTNWAASEQALHRWLRALPRPVGILAAQDQYGLVLTEVCRLVGLHVPDDVAVMGVDNDELICQLASPPLSSIATCGEQAGYEAARMLDGCMAGRPAPKRPLLLQTTGVVTRQSSDVFAVKDPELLAALRYIRDHAGRPLGVTEVAAEVCVSRRSLERRFLALLGRTPLQEIRHVRIGRVKRLLAETDLTVYEIAARTGFGGPERLSICFRQATGATPSGYRARYRVRS